MEHYTKQEQYALWLDDNRQLGDIKLPEVRLHWKCARSFGEAKAIVLRSGMPSFISIDYQLEDIQTCIPFLLWLMHEFWDENCGPPPPKYQVHSGTPEQIAEVTRLMTNWENYSH